MCLDLSVSYTYEIKVQPFRKQVCVQCVHSTVGISGNKPVLFGYKPGGRWGNRLGKRKSAWKESQKCSSFCKHGLALPFLF